MASRSDTKSLADATTKLGRTVAEALRSWTEEVGADDIANDVMDCVREGFDVFLENAKEAADKARATAQGATVTLAEVPSNRVVPLLNGAYEVLGRHNRKWNQYPCKMWPSLASDSLSHPPRS